MPEAVHVYQEGQSNRDHQQKQDENSDNLCRTFHDVLLREPTRVGTPGGRGSSLSNQEADLLRFLLELWIRQRAAVKLFLPFAALLVHHARSGFHLRLGFLRASQPLQKLSSQIMDARTLLVELACGLNLRQRLFELAFALINTGQLVMRTGECRIEPQCFAKILFCFLISLLKVVNHPKLIVVVRDVGIECYIFEKFRFSAIEILLFEISPSEIEMNEGEPGIALSREIKFLDGIVVFFVIDVSFANEQVHFWGVLSDFRHPSQCSLVEIAALSLPRCDAEHVEVIQLIRRLCPQWFESGDGIGVAVGEEVTESQKIAGLIRRWHIAHNRLEGCDGGGKIILAVVDQSNI